LGSSRERNRKIARAIKRRTARIRSLLRFMFRESKGLRVGGRGEAARQVKNEGVLIAEFGLRIWEIGHATYYRK
jgi:hypothetical protein